MNWHVFQRASTHALLAFLGIAGGIAATAKEVNAREIAPWEVVLVLGGFLVMLAGALTLALVRWLGKVERNVPRDPHRVDSQLRNLDGRVDAMAERVAHLEGRLSLPNRRREG